MIQIQLRFESTCKNEKDANLKYKFDFLQMKLFLTSSRVQRLQTKKCYKNLISGKKNLVLMNLEKLDSLFLDVVIYIL